MVLLTEVTEAMDPLEESLEKYAEACVRVIWRYEHDCDARSVAELKEQIEATLSLLRFSSRYLRKLPAKVDALPLPGSLSPPAADTQPSPGESSLQFSSQYIWDLAAKVDALPSPRGTPSPPETDTLAPPAADTQPLRRVTLPSNQEIQDSMLPDSLDRRCGEKIDAAVDAAAAFEEDPWFRAEEARQRYPAPRVHERGYDVFDRRRTQEDFWPRGSVQ
ncbi:uncharacterized protein BO66DRAFT_402899 [Aspergillus aculeatinus CBS 121060]|uniref:Uncharacterized protein n=1 Tax=Aspergillus aculeatinus CBS 121060 TaxID=1448322 RepID=A0ACD1H4A2_9EURO|nr:hypothetical protein BO66DRAFT_402899 [Aspergillus aculeatinus CBS 121060]RAH68445.1 hypothetical protein BO66DRAFT_402899 [Aspergillus aculeatinus CBS 121060]